MSKKIDHNKIIRKIAENYIQLEKSIVSQLRLSCDHHYVTIGSFREEIWQSLFKQIVPKKFSVERSVFIIDSHGKVSKEVDLVIFDEQYTPYIFNYGQIKYIPIEAVAVVVQCKSTHIITGNLKDWVDSITQLKTSQRSVARMYPSVVCGEDTMTQTEDSPGKQEQCSQTKPKLYTQTSTRPIRILCHLHEQTTEMKSIAELFDISIRPERNRLKTAISSGSLSEWYEKLNHADDDFKHLLQPFTGSAKDASMDDYRIFEKKNGDAERGEISLLSLIFQLNQLLMLINNPILFPHQAYVAMFERSICGKGANL